MDSTAAQLNTTLPSPLFDRPFILSMGPQRAGTSWLDRYLRSRGDICLPSGVKEIFFFDRHYERGTEFYRGHFQPQPAHKIAMEISTTAFDAATAPRRIFETFGQDIKLICPLRHPVTRSYSLYRHYKRYGLVSGTLQEACTQIPQILTSSHYAHHIENWLSVFNKNKNPIHFVFQENMEADLNAYIADICNILQIPCLLPSTDISKRYNSYAAAPIPIIARAANKSANWLRSRKLYPVVNAAKKIGLKRLVLGIEKHESGPGLIPAADHQWLEDRLSGQVESLEKIIGPVPQFHSRSEV